ncbi:CBS domain-containing protein [Psychromonas ossibalaenae]|uniref:CBS domain-containing protein n=1 Tax=Psychromonas ossibalaenae TaxID=444922 RepID=UPI00036ECEC7|nr:CBS domain-containing protein [Psychromonas ossibalaenae]
MSTAVVKEIMKKSPFTVQCQTPLNEIVKTLVKTQQSQLPVVNQSNKLIGMVSQVDCHKALLVSGYHCDQPVKVNNIMAESYPVLNPQDRLSEAAIKTQEETADIFAVVEEDRLVGIVKRVDLLTLLNENLSLCSPA